MSSMSRRQAAKSACVALNPRPRVLKTAPMNSRGASTTPSLSLSAGWSRSCQSSIGLPPFLPSQPCHTTNSRSLAGQSNTSSREETWESACRCGRRSGCSPSGKAPPRSSLCLKPCRERLAAASVAIEGTAVSAPCRIAGHGAVSESIYMFLYCRVKEPVTHPPILLLRMLQRL